MWHECVRVVFGSWQVLIKVLGRHEIASETQRRARTKTVLGIDLSIDLVARVWKYRCQEVKEGSERLDIYSQCQMCDFELNAAVVVKMSFWAPPEKPFFQL
jgi:hypothetical protein